MDRPWGHYAKWSEQDRERKISYDISYMWNLKIYINEPIYKIKTDPQTEKTTCQYQNGKGVGINESLGLPYTHCCI